MTRRTALLAAPAALLAAALLWGRDASGETRGRIGVTDTGSGLVDPAPPHSVIRPWSPPARSRSQVIKDVLPASVRIAFSKNGVTSRSASGVVLALRETKAGPVGYVITNAHVVANPGPDPARVEVLVDRKAKTRRFQAKVIAEGSVPDADLALLEVPGLEGVRAAELVADGDLELGDDVVVVGAPYGRGLSISSGIVSQLDWDEAGAARGFKTDAPIGYGASGGGIFRVPDGKLLAVVEGYRTAKVSFPMAEKSYSFDVPMPGETFAAPAAKVRAFLRDAGVAGLVLAGEPHAAR